MAKVLHHRLHHTSPRNQNDDHGFIFGKHNYGGFSVYRTKYIIGPTSNIDQWNITKHNDIGAWTRPKFTRLSGHIHITRINNCYNTDDCDCGWQSVGDHRHCYGKIPQKHTKLVHCIAGGGRFLSWSNYNAIFIGQWANGLLDIWQLVSDYWLNI